MLIVNSRTRASQDIQYHILSIMHGKLVGREVPEGLELEIFGEKMTRYDANDHNTHFLSEKRKTRDH
jgi:hypothetical protein